MSERPPAGATDATPRAGAFADRVVVVTGAAGGVGSSLVREFAAAGATVVACDIDADRLQAVTADASPGSTTVPFVVELQDPEACRAVIDRTIADFGRIDALVNNAALLRSGPLATFPVEAFDAMVAVNVRAPFVLSQCAFGWMAANGGGRIVNIASVGARDGGGSLDVAAYTTTKSGLLGMTKAFAKFGAPFGVLVNAVLPGGIGTQMIEAPAEGGALRSDVPLGRLASPDEIAKLVLWLSSEENTYCVGAAVDINGGRYLS